MDKVLAERLEHSGLKQPETPLNQDLQLIEPINDHIAEPVECIVVVTL
jgi:hypothetical protein